MGLQFGELPIHLRRLLYYHLSPYEQKAWAKTFSHSVPNMMRRIFHSFPRVAPAFIIMRLVQNWATAEHWRLSRKDPKEFENDK